MTVLERYYAALDQKAAHHTQLAAQTSDERERSLQLMQASMCGDMLKQLGRVQHQGLRPDALPKLVDSLTAEEARMAAQGDADAADKAHIKAETIRWAMDTLEALEHGNA